MTDKYHVRDAKGKVIGEIEKASTYSSSSDHPGLWELIWFTFLSGLGAGLLAWGFLGIIFKILSKAIGDSYTHSNAFVFSGNIAWIIGACAASYYFWRYLQNADKRSKVLDDLGMTAFVIIFMVILSFVILLIAWAFR